MPAPVTTDVLQQYLLGVVARADHHADNVNEVVLSLAGAIIWRKGPDDLEVMVRDGVVKNVLWVRINGQRYALSYNHNDRTIEMRCGSTQGLLVRERPIGAKAWQRPLSLVLHTWHLKMHAAAGRERRVARG
jgi:hypothetical protein